MTRNNNMQCKSCGVKLKAGEQLRTTKDGTLYLEDFCQSCVDKYITNIDSLDWKEHAFEDLSRVDYSEYDDLYE